MQFILVFLEERTADTEQRVFEACLLARNGYHGSHIFRVICTLSRRSFVNLCVYADGMLYTISHSEKRRQQLRNEIMVLRRAYLYRDYSLIVPFLLLWKPSEIKERCIAGFQGKLIFTSRRKESIVCVCFNSVLCKAAQSIP